VANFQLQIGGPRQAKYRSGLKGSGQAREGACEHRPDESGKSSVTPSKARLTGERGRGIRVNHDGSVLLLRGEKHSVNCHRQPHNVAKSCSAFKKLKWTSGQAISTIWETLGDVPSEMPIIEHRHSWTLIAGFLTAISSDIATFAPAYQENRPYFWIVSGFARKQ
jgi:hypothetical protein